METKILVDKHFEMVRRLGGGLNHPNFKTEEEYKNFCIKYLEGFRRDERVYLWKWMMVGAELSTSQLLDVSRLMAEINTCFCLFP